MKIMGPIDLVMCKKHIRYLPTSRHQVIQLEIIPFLTVSHVQSFTKQWFCNTYFEEVINLLKDVLVLCGHISSQDIKNKTSKPREYLVGENVRVGYELRKKTERQILLTPIAQGRKGARIQDVKLVVYVCPRQHATNSCITTAFSQLLKEDGQWGDQEVISSYFHKVPVRNTNTIARPALPAASVTSEVRQLAATKDVFRAIRQRSGTKLSSATFNLPCSKFCDIPGSDSGSFGAESPSSNVCTEGASGARTDAEAEVETDRTGSPLKQLSKSAGGDTDCGGRAELGGHLASRPDGPLEQHAVTQSVLKNMLRIQKHLPQAERKLQSKAAVLTLAVAPWLPTAMALHDSPQKSKHLYPDAAKNLPDEGVAGGLCQQKVATDVCNIVSEARIDGRPQPVSPGSSVWIVCAAQEWGSERRHKSVSSGLSKKTDKTENKSTETFERDTRMSKKAKLQQSESTRQQFQTGGKSELTSISKAFSQSDDFTLPRISRVRKSQRWLKRAKLKKLRQIGSSALVHNISEAREILPDHTDPDEHSCRKNGSRKEDSVQQTKDLEPSTGCVAVHDKVRKSKRWLKKPRLKKERQKAMPALVHNISEATEVSPVLTDPDKHNSRKNRSRKADSVQQTKELKPNTKSVAVHEKELTAVSGCMLKASVGSHSSCSDSHNLAGDFQSAKELDIVQTKGFGKKMKISKARKCLSSTLVEQDESSFYSNTFSSSSDLSPKACENAHSGNRPGYNFQSKHIECAHHVQSEDMTSDDLASKSLCASVLPSPSFLKIATKKVPKSTDPNSLPSHCKKRQKVDRSASTASSTCSESDSKSTKQDRNNVDLFQNPAAVALRDVSSSEPDSLGAGFKDSAASGQINPTESVFTFTRSKQKWHRILSSSLLASLDCNEALGDCAEKQTYGDKTSSIGKGTAVRKKAAASADCYVALQRGIDYSATRPGFSRKHSAITDSQESQQQTSLDSSCSSVSPPRSIKAKSRKENETPDCSDLAIAVANMITAQSQRSMLLLSDDELQQRVRALRDELRAVQQGTVFSDRHNRYLGGGFTRLFILKTTLTSDVNDSQSLHAPLSACAGRQRSMCCRTSKVQELFHLDGYQDLEQLQPNAFYANAIDGHRLNMRDRDKAVWFLKRRLDHDAPLQGVSEGQVDIIMDVLLSMFDSTQFANLDYLLRVILPEAVTRVYNQVHHHQ